MNSLEALKKENKKWREIVGCDLCEALGREILLEENAKLKQILEKAEEVEQNYLILKVDNDLLNNIANERLKENEKLKKVIEILKKYYKFKLFPPAMDNIPEISISTDWEHYISQQEYDLLKDILGD